MLFPLEDVEAMNLDARAWPYGLEPAKISHKCSGDRRVFSQNSF
jgi:hypothetical protein